MNIKETYDWYAKAGYLKALPFRVEGQELTLYNYTTQCVFKGNWNYHTLSARGLVLDECGDFLARPFKKFFGLNEREHTYLKNLPDETPEIAIKHDGSLVIVFQLPSGTWTAVTRGSWDNKQIQCAKEWLHEYDWCLQKGYTYCFELVAPWNQIVIPYKDTKMILLGRVDPYGQESTYEEAHKYALDQYLEPVTYWHQRVDEIDLDNISYKIEGYVARYSNGLRVKLKATHYFERHKEMTYGKSRS